MREVITVLAIIVNFSAKVLEINDATAADGHNKTTKPFIGAINVSPSKFQRGKRIKLHPNTVSLGGAKLALYRSS